jgi:hypothetical protein
MQFGYLWTKYSRHLEVQGFIPNTLHLNGLFYLQMLGKNAYWLKFIIPTLEFTLKEDQPYTSVGAPFCGGDVTNWGQRMVESAFGLMKTSLCNGIRYFSE